jgi:sec-independent protein translocase protein TatB
MNFFGIGALELIFILMIALIIIGPKDIGKYARSAGRFLNRFYRSDAWRMIRDTSRNLRNLPSRLAREAALEELEDIKRSLQDSMGDLTAVQHRLEQTEKVLTNESQVSGEAEAHRVQEGQDPDEDLKAWTPQASEPNTTKKTSPADEAHDNEGER